MLFKKHLFITLLTLFCCLIQQISHAQCTTLINSFPYDEGFEASDGNWVRSSADHWEWGQIVSKPVITAAGGGTKCWLVGGLSGSSYNSGSSYLQSPCFNISSLSFPEIAFKIFWETEKRYDGANIQYSLDGGLNWIILGSVNSNGNCLGENWFNADPINFLGGAGWCGNIQSTSGSCQGGGGSGRWLTARHSLESIAGATSVIFRFAFAAGLTCNDFDGFAIDDIHIGEIPPNAAGFTYTCDVNNTASFNSTSVGCKTSVDWNFGDIASGTNNTSTLDNPIHIFSAPGSYTISFTTHFATGPDLSQITTVKVIDATATITNNIKCNGDNTAAINVAVSPTGTYDYSWDTNPVQVTPAISNLVAGNYVVTITGTNACTVSLPILITEPEKIVVNPIATTAKCGSNNGSIITNISGGITPYGYLWSTGAVTPSISNLSSGSYSLLVTDANNCAVNISNIPVNPENINVSVSLGRDTSICPGEMLLLNPGNFASYKWQDNSVAATFSVTKTGTYTVEVKDASGCTGNAKINVIVDCSEIFFPSAITPNGDGNNDGFGPLPYSALASLQNYKLTIYGRWGEVIFKTNDPFQKWDGNYKGKPLPVQTLTWIASYTQKNLAPDFQKGTISIVR